MWPHYIKNQTPRITNTGCTNKGAGSVPNINQSVIHFKTNTITTQMSTRQHTTFLTSLLVATLVTLCTGQARADVAAIKANPFAEPGSHAQWRESVSTVDERVDPFGGSLQLSYIDLVIPGTGGLDIRIQRHYTSNIWLTRPGNIASLPPYPKAPLADGPAGLGWTLDFGRVVRSERDPSIGTGKDDGVCGTYTSPTEQGTTTIPGHTTSENAVLELPDGSQQVLVVNATSYAALFITRSRWIANCLPNGLGLMVYSPHGLKYTMDYAVTSPDEVTYTTRRTRAWYPTRIEDGNGNYLTVTYQGQKGSHALIKQVTSKDLRVVDFSYTPDNYISTISANGQTWRYDYDVPAGTTGHKLLKTVTRPDALVWGYQYNPYTASVGPLALQQVTYPYGATVAYTYNHVDFVGDATLIGGDALQKFLAVAVASKTQGGNAPALTWTYSYAPGTEHGIEPGFRNDITTVTFPSTTTSPGGKYVYKHFGLQRQLDIVSQLVDRELWKSGLLREKETYNTINGQDVLVDKELYTWAAPGVISFEKDPSPVYGYIDKNVFDPKLTDKTIIRDGTSYATHYIYETAVGGVTTYYARPVSKIETGQVGALYEKTRHTDFTYFPADPAKVWLYDQVNDEIVENTVAYSTLRKFDATTGNLLEYQPLGVYEGYSYHPGTGDMKTRTNANGFVSTYNDYHRGIPRQDIHPVSATEVITLGRTVNDTGTVASETNGRGYTTQYQYDSLNRPKLITPPLNATTSATWNATSRVVTRGKYQQIQIFDGFGRVICDDAQDTTTGKHVTRVTRYNALGYKSFESYPYAGSCPAAGSPAGDIYTTDVLGRITRVDHPDGTFAYNVYLAANAVRTTNERGLSTTYYYRSFGNPDNAGEKALMRIDSPENIGTVFTRNMIGQMETVTQGTRDAQGNIISGITRSYTYDLLVKRNNFLLNETNPETGATTYTRDGMGNMTSRKVGTSGITTYYHDRQNRLTGIDYPMSTTPDVGLYYDHNSNLKQIKAQTPGGVNIASMETTQRDYNYDANDNLINESLWVSLVQNLGSGPQVIDDRTLTAQYEYDSLDHLNSITYPSNQIVNLAPDGLGFPARVGPYTTSVGYYANGQPSFITFANGRRTDYGLNSRQWVENIATTGSVNIVNLTYSYDGWGNIKTITDGINNSKNRSLDYDGVDRLTNANGIWGSATINYDTVGNIKTYDVGAVKKTYYYDTNNRISSITGSPAYTLGYDTYGNISGNGRNAFNYDDAGNLRCLNGNTCTVNQYDGNNLRVRDGAAFYLYAKNGDLLGEYNRTDPTAYKEYAYLGGKLIAAHTVANNQLPAANAGIARMVEQSTTVTLAGSGSDADGVITSYAWTQTAGPSVTLSGAMTATASFTSPAVTVDTVLTFLLTVTDDQGGQGTASVDITVRNGTIPPQPREGTITITPGFNQNTLQWEPVPRASGYNIYWSTSPNVTPSTGTAILVVTSPYVHTGLVNGTTYYYVITAVGTTNIESIASSVVAIAPGVNGWSPPMLVEKDDTKSTQNSSLAVSKNGTAIILWKDSPGQLWYSLYSPAAGWGEPAVLPGGPYTTSVLSATTAIDQNGNIIVAWVNMDAVYGSYGLYATRYVPGTGWRSPPIPVSVPSSGSTDLRNAVLPVLAVGPNGDMALIWRQTCCTASNPYYSVMASNYMAGTNTWSAPNELARYGNLGGQRIPIPKQLMLDTAGNALAVWNYRNVSPNNGSYAIVTGTYLASPAIKDWGNVTTVSNTIAGNLASTAAMSSDGKAIMVYKLSTGTSLAMRTFSMPNALYTTNGGWGSTATTVPGSSGADGGALNKDNLGGAILVFGKYEEIGLGQQLVYYASHYSGSTWDVSPTVLGRMSYSNGERGAAGLVQDPLGKPMALLTTSTVNSSALPQGSVSIWSRRFDSLTGWSKAQRVADRSGVFNLKDAAMDGSGNVLAVESDDNSLPVNHLWTSRYFSFGVDPSTLNNPPIAFISAPNSVSQGTSVSLDGSLSSDLDGTISSYSWTQIYGPSVILTGANTATAGFISSHASGDTFVFKLTVADNQGATDTAMMSVNVNSTPPPNQAPTANAGAVQTVDEGATVTLYGAGADTDGSIVSYSWSQTGTPTVSLTTLTASSVSFIAPAVTSDTVLAFTLTVTDDRGATGTASTMVTVKNVNQLPIASATAPVMSTEATAVSLNGSASSDPDGTIASYSWKQITGPPVILTGAAQATASFTVPYITANTSLAFTLTVTDNDGASATSAVYLTVKILDTDADGLSDYWEQSYFGNLAQSGSGDPDFDFLSNLTEALNGSNPTVPAPAAVSGFKAVGNAGKTTLSWTVVTNATRYNLYWRNSPGVTPSTGNRISVTSSPYVHLSLTNGVTYYYIITAVNNGGESVLSAEVRATPAEFGDLNADGLVDVADVALVERIALGLLVPTADQLLHGDVAPLNGLDGVIDAADVARIRRKALGLENF